MKNKSPIDENELKEAIASRDEKKLKAFIDIFTKQKTEKKDAGEMLTDDMMTYMQLINETNNEYLGQLKSTLDALKTIDAGEKEVDNELKITAVRKKLISKIEEDDLD
jgi:hypothetical protein